MNIAIIGCGYVGQAVARYWQERNFMVTVTTTTPEKVTALSEVADRVVILQGNDVEGMLKLLENQDTVLLSVGAKNSDTYTETYLQTAQTLISVMQQMKTVQQVIYTSSYSVYGLQNGASVDEETPVTPINSNGEILCETEKILLQGKSENLRVCILRLGGIYGPGRELVKIFGRAAGSTRPGDGKDITNWIHLDDIVAALEFAREHRLHGIYNLVDDAHLSSRELFERLCTQHNLPQVSWDATQQSNRAYNSRVSNQKLKDAGYKLIHPQMIF